MEDSRKSCCCCCCFTCCPRPSCPSAGFSLRLPARWLGGAGGRHWSALPPAAPCEKTAYPGHSRPGVSHSPRRGRTQNVACPAPGTYFLSSSPSSTTSHSTTQYRQPQKWLPSSSLPRALVDFKPTLWIHQSTPTSPLNQQPQSLPFWNL